MGCLGPSPSPEDGTPGGPREESSAGYEPTGYHALLEPAPNRGRATGGFGHALSFADFAYRLGTASVPVPDGSIDDLLNRYGKQVGLVDDHLSALRRVLGERSAFAAWKQFFADGGRVRPFVPVAPEDLATTPPSQLALVGNGRYLSDRLLVLSPPDEPDMESFLFHEIQHYVLDKWDCAVFEVGEGAGADHEVIEILEERRRIVEALRSGRIPRGPGPDRVLHDRTGDVTAALEAGRWAEAVERAQGTSFYEGWVDGALQGVLAKNDNRRRIRMVSMELSDGRTLLFDERSDRTAPDSIKAADMRIPPHYRHGPVVYVSLGDLGRFDTDRLLSQGYVLEDDRHAVDAFVEAHREDRARGREHIFDEPQLRDMAHLAAYNAAIFQQSLRLGEWLRESTDDSLEEVMRAGAFQAAFADFLRRFSDQLAEGPGADPGIVGARVADAVMAAPAHVSASRP